MDIAYCTSCGDEFIQKTSSHSTCPKKECRKKFAEGKKKTAVFHSIVENQKKIKKKKEVDYTRTLVVKKAIQDDMIAKYGYQYCELCGPQLRASNLELHHIIYRSEIPGHPQKHSKINSIVLHHDCHEWFHAQKNRRDRLIVERKLWEVFPETIRKDYYT